MIRLALLIAMLSAPVQAGMTQAQLQRVGVSLPDDAVLDLGLDLPQVLIFADFDCGHLCDAVLAQTVDALVATGLQAGRDYRLVVVGLDPRDDEAAAAAFLERQAPAEIRPAITLLQPDRSGLAMMTAALGYGYAFDEDLDAFAHPAARFVLASGGRVRAALPAFQAQADILRRALVGARLGTGSATTRLILLCYGFDPVTGRYSLLIWRVLTGLCILTVLVLASALAFAVHRGRRHA